MPKRKRGPKPAPQTVEERRARQEKVVHREDMTATVGEVLASEHVDEAIELLYKQDELSGKTPPEQSQTEVNAAMANIEEQETEQAEYVEATKEEQAEQEQPRSWREEAQAAREGDPDASEPRRRRRGVLRFLSPSFMMGATMSATGAIVGGVRRAAKDLLHAASKARHAFDGGQQQKATS
jgi:hypothetical protein